MTQSLAPTSTIEVPRARAEGAFIALAAGDALGWPQEFARGRGQRGVQVAAEFREWVRRGGGRYYAHDETIRAGEYSDDTQLTLAIARSRIHGGSAWWATFTRTELPLWTLYERGGGGATKRAAESWLRGLPPWMQSKGAAVRRYFEAGGNGVAMRIVPHAVFWAAEDDPTNLLRDVITDGAATHGHPRALVGAAAYAYAVWWLMRSRHTVGFGELVTVLLERAATWGNLPASSAERDGWLDATGSPGDYEKSWRQVVQEMVVLLGQVRDGLAAGSIADDEEVLRTLGAYGSAKGSGTVSAGAAIYLAARYAAQPVEGVLRGAFAVGSDTDTIAAMTGGLLGALAGTDWLPQEWFSVQDCDYMRQLANDLASRRRPDESPPVASRGVAQKDLDSLMDALRSGSREEQNFGGGRRARVVDSCTPTPVAQSTSVYAWQLHTSDGQTVYVKKVGRKTSKDTAHPDRCEEVEVGSSEVERLGDEQPTEKLPVLATPKDLVLPSASLRTARTILVEWANEQGHWIRTIAGDVLAARRPLAPERQRQLYEQFLVEKDLRSGPPAQVPPLSIEAVVAESTEALALVRLDAVENVNALTPGQTIDFNAGLTIVFGKNGTGKSGYVRILKRLARVRAVEAVLPNVVTPQRSQGLQHARISYRIGATQHSIEWKGEEGVHPLTRIDVFDARAIALHLDEDLTYVYTPSDLALFGHVHDAIEGVRTRLEADVRASTTGTNPFLAKFSRDTRVFPKIESLSAATDLVELEQLGTLSRDEVDGLDGLRERVNALRPEASNPRVLQADADRRLLESVLTLCSVLRRFDTARYQGACEFLAAAVEKYRLSTESAFAGTDIPGALTDAWRAFVVAGDAYRGAVAQDKYPATGDKCLYCRQDLAASALDLLRKYRDYCNNQVKKELDAARADLATVVRELLAFDLGPLVTEVGRREQLTQAEVSPRLKSIATVVATGRDIQDAARGGRPIDALNYTKVIGELEPGLQAQFVETKKHVDVLRGQVEDRKRSYAEELARLRDLEARLVLRELLPDIRTHLNRARWANKAQTLSARFRPLLKSLTEGVKEASESLLNQDFERLFRAECQTLRAPTVRLDFPGRKGQAARRKVLASDYKLSDILSEGEQKVIALADFLAEAQLKASPNPIVFDDPVTSLDYQRIGEVVDRIARLSARRQVVVFTHNIWFAIEMVNRFEKNREACSYFDIAEDAGRYGIVSGGTNPRADSVKTISKRINSAIGEAKKATGESLAALIETGYEHVRSWCEVVVEGELLHKVVQRYQPNVMMTALGKINVQALGPAIGTIVPLFDKACRYIAGHSQPLETLNVRPTLAELEKDWADLQAALKTYRDAARDGPSHARDL